MKITGCPVFIRDPILSYRDVKSPTNTPVYEACTYDEGFISTFFRLCPVLIWSDGSGITMKEASEELADDKFKDGKLRDGKFDLL